MAPCSLPPSYVTYSDTTDSLNKTIAESLSELYGNPNESNADSNAQSGDSNVEQVTVMLITLRLKLKILRIMVRKERNFTVVVSAQRSCSQLMV